MDTQHPLLPRPDIDRPPVTRKRRMAAVILAVVVLMAIAAAVWHHRHVPKSDVGPSGTGVDQAGVSVAIATAERHDVPIVLTGLGAVTSLATVTVKSQISGYLTQIPFTEGELVHKGDLLAQVDSRPYEALLNQYEGTLAQDQAHMDNATLILARYRTLSKQDSISRQDVDTEAATVRQYQGTVRADEAQVEAEKLNIAYCQIISPVTGRVGLRQVDIGNYVQASDTTGIVIVTQMTPISVEFTLPEDMVPKVRERFRLGLPLTVDAYDRSNAAKIAEGRLESLDNEIDATTGTLKLRALFPNEDESLFPNQFVNARLLVDTVRNTITVPPAAVQQGAEGSTVYVVDGANKVHLRKVQTGASDSQLVAVTSGLAAGDRVVTDGADRLQDGATVSVVAPQS
jgi:membrane fusion protein, multidrug efflux system